MNFWKNNILTISFLISIVIFFAWKDNAHGIILEIKNDVNGSIGKIEKGIEQVFLFLHEEDLADSMRNTSQQLEECMKENQVLVDALVEAQVEEMVIEETCEEIANEEVVETEVIEEKELFTRVSDDYFVDAAFIGDSRTVGLYDYSDLPSDFFCSSGLTVYKIFKNPDGRFKDGNWKQNIETSLTEKEYGKIYVMVGINELGVGDATYYQEHYREMLLKIHELQPNAIIYIEANMNVTKERSEKGDYITNEELSARNAAIAELADDETYFYIDMNEAVCDESGALNPEYTFDGVHLYANYISLWTDFLRQHAVVKE